MTKVDIFSGFLGAGKTTLIRKLIEEAYGDEKIVLIENEFGEIGVDKGFLKNTGIQINQMNAGCICCTLVGDFGKALNEVIEQYHPDRILIEPSGVGKLSDVIIAVQDLENEEIQLNGFTTVVDAKKAKMYLKNFGEFYVNQVEHASSIILSHVQGLSQEKIDQVIGLLREHNTEASIVTTDWKEISGKKILETMEQKKTLSAELDHLREEAHREQEEHEAEHHHHDHDHEDHDHECGCEHHHDHEEHDHDHEEHGCCGHHEHHQDHDHEEHEHHHHHHHDHDHEDSCSCGHDHDADEVFISWGAETPRKYTEAEITGALNALADEAAYGVVLRAKGIVPCDDGTWIHFDYVPGEENVRRGPAGITGRLCVIGSELNEDALDVLFHLN